MKSELLLLELVNQRPHWQAKSDSSTANVQRAHHQRTMDLRALKEELTEEPEISISRNLGPFERKFEMQDTGLEQTQKTNHENQPVIKGLMSPGMHDKIRDNVCISE